jgi:hypothetical protein
MKHTLASEMMDQKQNFKKLERGYLDECRVRWTAWGCEKQCVEKATKKLRHLNKIIDCHCPAAFTVHGDTKILF